MTVKSHRSFRKHFIKLFFIILAVFIVAIGAGYIWFVRNSKKLLIDLVDEKSGGRLKLKLAEATFNFLNSDVNIREASITSTNKNSAPISYQVSFRKIKLHTNSIWSLLVHRSLENKEIKEYYPNNEVYNNKVN